MTYSKEVIELIKRFKSRKDGAYVILRLLAYYFPTILHRNSPELIEHVIDKYIKTNGFESPRLSIDDTALPNGIINSASKRSIDMKDFLNYFGIKF